MMALAVSVVWAAYLVRDVLLLLYVSGLLAIGFSPIVRVIERQTVVPIGTRRFPRWLAILILYVIILGTLASVIALVFPPLIRQAHQLWDVRADIIDRGLAFLVAKGVLSEDLTREVLLREAVERAPGGGSQAVGTVFSAVIGVVGGIVGLLTILILTFYLLVESNSLRKTFIQLFRKPIAHG